MLNSCLFIKLFYPELLIELRLKGLSDPKDGVNLGLHKMAHAMSLENRFTKNGQYGFISTKSYERWRELTEEEMRFIKSGEKSFFRPYAAVNIEEFLAVSVEVFFEKPKEFKTYQ